MNHKHLLLATAFFSVASLVSMDPVPAAAAAQQATSDQVITLVTHKHGETFIDTIPRTMALQSDYLRHHLAQNPGETQFTLDALHINPPRAETIADILNAFDRLGGLTTDSENFAQTLVKDPALRDYKKPSSKLLRAFHCLGLKPGYYFAAAKLSPEEIAHLEDEGIKKEVSRFYHLINYRRVPGTPADWYFFSVGEVFDYSRWRGYRSPFTPNIRDMHGMPINSTEGANKVTSESLGMELLGFDLDNQNIDTINPEHFRGMAPTHQMSLKENNIAQLPAEAFATIAGLHSIYLDRNPLKRIEPSMFAGIPHLQKLVLDHCNIDHFEVGQMPLLYLLSLSGNKLKHWNTELFKRLPKLSVLFLDRNPLVNDEAEKERIKKAIPNPKQTDVYFYQPGESKAPAAAKP